MSLTGSMFSGISAMNSTSQAMGVISDNISNMNTAGYKETDARFSTLERDRIRRKRSRRLRRRRRIGLAGSGR